jgi:hypothetical protein
LFEVAIGILKMAWTNKVSSSVSACFALVGPSVCHCPESASTAVGS